MLPFLALVAAIAIITAIIVFLHWYSYRARRLQARIGQRVSAQ